MSLQNIMAKKPPPSLTLTGFIKAHMLDCGKIGNKIKSQLLKLIT